MSGGPETTCRLCPATSATLDVMVMCFGAKPNQTSIATVLNKHFWFELDRLRDATAFICQPCWLKVHSFHQFYQSVLAMYRTSMKWSELSADRAASAEPIAPPICELQLPDTEANYITPDALSRSDPFHSIAINEIPVGNCANRLDPCQSATAAPMPISKCTIDLPPLDIKPDYQSETEDPPLEAKPEPSKQQRRGCRERRATTHKSASLDALPRGIILDPPPGCWTIPYTFVNGHTADSQLLYCEQHLYRLKKPIRRNQRYVCHVRTCKSALFLRDGAIIKLSSFQEHNHAQQEQVFRENIARARRKNFHTTDDFDGDFSQRHCNKMMRRSRIAASAKDKFK